VGAALAANPFTGKLAPAFCSKQGIRRKFEIWQRDAGGKIQAEF